MNTLLRLLRPPVFADERQTEQAYLLYIIVWVLVLVPVPYVAFVLSNGADDPLRVMAQVGFGEAVNFLLLFMIRKGWVQAASMLQVSMFWLFFTVTAFTGSGVQGEAYLLGYVLVIAIAGILLGGSGAAIFTVLSLAAGWWMVHTQAQGLVGRGSVSSPTVTWIVSLVLFPVGAVLQYLSSRALRRALARAQASEARYSNIIENAEEIVFTFSPEGNFTSVSPTWARLLGHQIEEVVGHNFTEFVHPEDVPIGMAVIQNLLVNGTTQKGIEYRVRHKDGRWRWHHSVVATLRDENSTAVTFIGIAQDVTERRESEERLKAERDLLQVFIDNIPDNIYFKDVESRFIRVNRAQAAFLNIGDPSEAIGKTDMDFQGADFGRQFLEEEQRILTTGQPVVNRVEYNPTTNGEPRWLAATKQVLRDSAGQVIGLIGISRDITEQKQAEEKLQTIFLQQAAILNNIPDMAWLKDLDSRYIAVNEQFAHTAGKRREEIIGKTDLEIWDAEFATLYRKDDQEVIQSGQRKRVEELQADGTGRQYWVETTKTPIKDENGQVIGTTGIARDISDRKLAQEFERRRRERLEKVMRLGQYVTVVHGLQTTLQRIWYSVRNEIGFDRLGIYLYDREANAMLGTFGTDHQGRITQEQNRVISLNTDSPETVAFKATLKEANGLYQTRDYEHEHGTGFDNIMAGVRDFAAVSAWMGEIPAAVLCVDNAISGRPITEEQIETLRLFAGYAGLAIEHARLNDALQKELTLQIKAEQREIHRRETLEKVLGLGKRVAKVADLRTTLENIWRGVHDDLEFDRLAIFLYNVQDNVMDDTFGTNAQGEMVDYFGLSFPLFSDENESTTFTQVLKKPDGLFFTHDYSGENRIPPGHEMHGVGDFVAVAVWAGDSPVAVICADNHLSQRPISNEQLEALRLFSGYAGLAIENARLNTALEADLTRRKALIDELENKNAELERFTYTVSHDLKSPLVTISGFLGYLEQDVLSGNTDRLHSSVARITSAAHKMQDLLNDLLELSRIGRLINPPEDVLFSEIVHEAVDRVRGKLDAINATVEIQRDMPVVHGDKVRLIEVMQNLVENAAKYSQPQKRTKIEIGSQADAEGQALFYVRDNGIGIALEYHERIFGLFNKLDPLAEGTGIGLTLVKRIIEVHGGRIWVESTPGAGATFYFTLPVQAREI